MKEKIWHTYFWFLLLFSLISLGFDLRGVFNGRTPEVSDLFSTIVSLIGIAGVFGFVYKRALLDARFWKMILLINVLTIFFSANIIHVSLQGAAEHKMDGILLLITMLIIMLPQTLALYLYSFKSKDLWC